MNTKYLEYAIELEKAGSFSKAAENLYMAQPNLSRCIKELEAELGYAIFDRTTSGVRSTEKGMEFLFHAKRMMEQISEIQRIAHSSDNVHNRYKLSIPRGSYIVDGVTSMISDISFNNQLEITIHETNSMTTIDNVTDRCFNTGIIRVPLEEEEYFKTLLKQKDLVGEIIWEFDVVLVMSKKHPLAQKESISAADLEPYIRISHADIEVPKNPHHILNKFNDGYQVSEKAIYIYERGSQFDLLTNVPNTYMWVSPIPQRILERNHLVQRACPSVHNRYKDILIYRKDYELSEYDKLFQKKLYEAKVEVKSQRIN